MNTEIILIPVYNDFRSLEKLLSEFSSLISKNDNLKFMIINDGSDPAQTNAFMINQINNLDLTIINNEINMGHQKAIILGLKKILEKYKKINILIMDGDGEDKPSDALEMLADFRKLNGVEVIRAKRGNRSNSLDFRIFYMIYRIFFRLLVGISLPYGNFMVINHELAFKIFSNEVNSPHIASMVEKLAKKKISRKLDRGERYDGNSKMNKEALIRYGYSAITFWSDRLTIRLLILMSTLIVISALVSGLLIITKFFTEVLLPGWLSLVILIVGSTVLIILSQLFLFMLISIKIDK